MELFVEAEKNYKEERFRSAYRGYCQCLEDKDIDKKTMLLCCQKIVKLSEFLNIQRGEGVERLLARSFFHLSEYREAIGHGEAIIIKKKSREIYEILWESCFREGNLVKAESIAENYLTYCKSKHLCDLGLGFIEKLKQRGFFKEKWAVMGMELEIMRGNKEFVIKKLEEFGGLHGENGNIPQEIVEEMNCYRRCIFLYKKYWESESVIRKIFLKHWRDSLKNHDILETDTTEREKIIYFILVDFLLEGKEFGKTLETYARVFKRDGLLASMNKYNNKKCSSENERDGFEEDVELILNKNVFEQSANNVVEKIGVHEIFLALQKKNNVEIFLDGLSDDFLINNMDNLLICLIEMELYESALKLINKMKDKIKKESVKYQINMAYMEIIVLEKSGKYYQAMDHIEDALIMLPVKKEERNTLQKKKQALTRRVDLSKDTV